ncbi:putative Ig domain-containing protein, partial [Euryarchaeota archaeon]|nr:putative Ig domain-containing protein [Euryarchaeota archaeon]
TCAILDDDSLKCWGYNNYGQLGIGSFTNQNTPQLVNLGTGRTAVSVSLGDEHPCAVLDDGSLKCWGNNNYGQLGIGSTTQQTTPQTVNLGTGRTAVSVSAGYTHTCAILDDGSLKCWGQGSSYRLGIGYSSSNHNTPQLVNLGTGRTAVSVSAGYQHSCAIYDDESLNCWGYNNYGQFGIGSTTAATPRHVSITQPTPYQFLSVSDNNSWFGIPNEVGLFNLDVWYNTSSSSTFHRIRANVTAPITYSASVNTLTINQSFSIVPVNISCDSCGFSIQAELPEGIEFNVSNASFYGTPSSVTSRNTFVISTFNFSGYSEVEISLEVVDFKPEITSSTTSLNYIRGFRNRTNDFSNSGGEVVFSLLDPPIRGLSPNNFGHENLLLNSNGACSITSLGLQCWGGQFSSDSLMMTDLESKMMDVSLSSTNSCAVELNGKVLCLGENTYGQISGSYNPNYSSQFREGDFDSVGSVTQVATTSNQICILEKLKNVFCQGERNYSITAQSFGTITALDSGEAHFCVLTTVSNLYCWGNNQFSAIGTSQSTSLTTYVQTPSLISVGIDKTVLDFDAGERHTCAVRNDSKVSCWGTGTSGQIGDGYTATHSSPQQVDSPSWASYTKVTAGFAHTCALLDDGGVMCWGNNTYGQLGDGTTNDSLIPTNVTVIPSSLNVVDVVAGDGGTCVVDDRAGVWCWGDNSNGKLGLNSTIQTAAQIEPLHFSESSALMGVLSFGSLTGAPLTLQSATSHRLFGNNSGGSDDVNFTISVGLAADYPTTQFNLTRNTSTVNVSPSITDGPYTFTAVPELPAGLNLGLSNGTIWGTPTAVHPLTNHIVFIENNSGYDNLTFSVQVHDIPPTIQYPFSSYTLVRNWTIEPIIPFHQDGEVENINISSPLPLGLEMYGLILQDPIQTESGGSHTCFIAYEILKCFGLNQNGQLGLGDTIDRNTSQIVEIGDNRTVVSVSTSNYNTCAVLDNGSLKCWGTNNNGQLGDGSNIPQITPQLVDLGTGRTAVSVDLGSSYTCAILDDGSLKCWGSNYYGQLGVGFSNANLNTPQPVNLGTGRTAVSVSSGQYHTCAILDDGSLKCWGRHYYGELGIGGSTGYNVQYSSPQAVDLGTGRTAVSVSLGLYHTCAILDDGSLKCWGDNNYGELGIGGTTGYGGQ